MPWRHVRDHARAMGVGLIRVGRKLAVPAAEFLEALGRERLKGAADVLDSSLTSADPVSTVRAMLGKRKRVA
jgi:hypothetical protein